VETAERTLSDAIDIIYQAMFEGDREPDDDVLLMAIEV